MENDKKQNEKKKEEGGCPHCQVSEETLDILENNKKENENDKK